MRDCEIKLKSVIMFRFILRVLFSTRFRTRSFSEPAQSFSWQVLISAQRDTLSCPLLAAGRMQGRGEVSQSRHKHKTHVRDVKKGERLFTMHKQGELYVRY